MLQINDDISILNTIKKINESNIKYKREKIPRNIINVRRISRRGRIRFNTRSMI